MRLHEDLFEIAPYALEDVPLELRVFINIDVDQPWDNTWHVWRDLPDSIVTDEEHANLIDFGATWLRQRTLGSLYLSPAANIRLCPDSDNVHIQWDNRSSEFKGQQAWSASTGTHTLPRNAFVEEVLSFHERFMSAMDKRINEVISGALPKSIRVDLDGLASKQQKRAASVNHSSLVRCPGTDWTHAAKAIARLKELRGET